MTSPDLSAFSSAAVSSPERLSGSTAGPGRGRLAEMAQRLSQLLATWDGALVELLATGVTLRASGDAEWAGSYVGRDAVVGYLLEVGEAFPDQELEVLDTLVSACRIGCLVRLTVRRDGASVVDESMWTFTFDRAGLIVDWELNDFDQSAMDAFWSRFPRVAP